EAGAHGPTVVAVRVTDINAMSAGPGVYTGSTSVASSKVPFPELVHNTPVAPAKVAFNWTVSPMQISCAAPASTVAAAATVITTSSDTGPQVVPGSFVVRRNV